jgi:hypothetical protein
MYTNPTNSPMNATSALPYSPVAQQQAVTTLLLIENSQAMSFIWADLRDRYLPSLVTRLESAELAALVRSHARIRSVSYCLISLRTKPSYLKASPKAGTSHRFLDSMTPFKLVFLMCNSIATLATGFLLRKFGVALMYVGL